MEEDEDLDMRVIEEDLVAEGEVVTVVGVLNCLTGPFRDEVTSHPQKRPEEGEIGTLLIMVVDVATEGGRRLVDALRRLSHNCCMANVPISNLLRSFLLGSCSMMKRRSSSQE